MESARLPAAAHAAAHPVTTHLAWFAAGAVLAFTVPYVGTTVLDLHHDVYLGIYVTFVVALLAAYVRATGLDAGALVRRRWKPSVAIGVVLLVPIVANVLSEPGTPRPTGVYFVFELLWRGGVYGLADALLLTAFPCAVVYSSLWGDLGGWRRKAVYGAASLILVMVITAVYHLGYRQYREDGVKAPETGNVLISIPTLLTANPVGSLIDHAGMHIAAVAHEYETDVRLPPPADAER